MRRLVLIISLLCFSCMPKKEIDIQGHRGCRGLMPENSMPAFQKAIDLGVNTLELDVVISKDHKIVVSHEPFLNHEITLDVYGDEIPEAEEKTYNLYKMPYDSIKKYNCGSKYHPRFPNQKKLEVYKPLLSEVIAMAEESSDKTIQYNIEIKSLPEYDGIYTPQVIDFVSLVLELIISEGVLERTTLQSFDIRALEEIHNQNTSVEIALLVDENEAITTKLSQLSFKPQIISPYFELLNAETVKNYKSSSFKVIPWTVNSETDISKMITFGVDGIISDYPDKVIAILNELR